MTAFGGVESAVEAMQRGAFHYVTKPFELDDAARARRARLPRARACAARERAAAPDRCASDAGRAAAGRARALAMRQLRELHRAGRRRVGRAGADPGRDRHRQGAGGARDPRRRPARATSRSWRSTAPRCPRRCSRASCSATRAAPSPGATADRRGLFVEAEGGTLFLDEIGDLPLRPAGQAAARPAGGRGAPRRQRERRAPSTCAVVAATHQDLGAAGRRRACSARISSSASTCCASPVPPLRARADDIPAPGRALPAREPGAERPARCWPASSPTRSTTWRSCDWPGNVRQLENLIERLVVTAADPAGAARGRQARARRGPRLGSPPPPGGEPDLARRAGGPLHHQRP